MTPPIVVVKPHGAICNIAKTAGIALGTSTLLPNCTCATKAPFADAALAVKIDGALVAGDKKCLVGIVTDTPKMFRRTWS